MRNLFFTIAFSALLASPAMAEELTVTHSAASAFESELNSALTDAGLEAAQVTSLKIVSAGEPAAEMNVTDFNALRAAMSATLQKLDLSEAALKGNSVPSSDEKNTQSGCGSLREMAELTEVVLPEGLTSISSGAFQNCKKLQTINLPETITDIWNYAFDGCTALSITKLPSQITIITPYCFRGCENMALTELPALTEVREYGFSTCRALSVSEIPETLTLIKQNGFASSGVTFSDWTEALTSIGESAFSGSKVTFKEWTPKIAEMPKGVFGYAYGITEFTIPETITKLNDVTFHLPTSFYYDASEDGANQGKNFKRKLICRLPEPPKATYGEAAKWNNTFMEEDWMMKNIYTIYVKKDYVETYKATAPYSSMNVEALTTQMPVAVEGGEATVSTELGEAAEGMLPVYEGNTTITITPADDMTIESVTYGETPVEVEDGVVTIDVPQTPETLTVTLKKSGEEAGVEGIASDDEIVATTYYNLQGVEISEPAENGLYIRKQTTANGCTIVEKVMLKAL